MSRPRTPIATRLLRRREIDPETGCWNWTGALDSAGYGHFRLPDGPRTVSTHRVSYLEFVGPVPPGLQLDHLCVNPRCFNPAHLEPVTPAENNRRAVTSPSSVNRAKTHCLNGHELSDENIYPINDLRRPVRRCKICNRERRNQQARANGVPKRSHKTECVRGHAYDEANTYPAPGGGRGCRKCRAIATREYRKRRAAERAAA